MNSCDFLPLSENARRVLEARYLRRDAEGRICETAEQLFARVARAVAHAELLLSNREQAAYWEERFYQLLTHLSGLPPDFADPDERWDAPRAAFCLLCVAGRR